MISKTVTLQIFYFGILQAEKILIQDLTRCEVFVSKSDNAKVFHMKILQVVKFLIQIRFFAKILFHIIYSMKRFASEACFLRRHKKRNSCCFHGVDLVRTRFFEC